MSSTRKLRLGVIMDPIEDIKVYKDSSFAMLLAAQRRGWELHYMLAQDLYVEGDQARGSSRRIQVEDRAEAWFELGADETIELGSLDAILMRKDPPFDMEYINTTYILDLAERAGSLIINRPQSLRDANEKMFITRFPQCCAPMLVSRSATRLREFVTQHQDVILKPLDGMGGASIFRVHPGDANLSVILETISEHGAKTVMAQRFIPEISAGDKRILMVDGVAVPYALARIPAQGETRGNLAAGGRGEGIELSDRDRWIAEQLGPTLKSMGVLFAGVDIIGDYLTEINITSPTCIRELDTIYHLDIAGQLMDVIAARCQQ